MIDVYCPRHRATVLLWPSNLRQVETVGDDVVVGWRCHCGQLGLTRVDRGPAIGVG